MATARGDVTAQSDWSSGRCWIAPLAAVVIAGLVYAATVARDLTWAHFSTDGGELITAAVTLGVPHPPGYPLYVLLGHVVSWVPMGQVALRFNLLSAVCGALAAGVVAACAQHWPRPAVDDDAAVTPWPALAVGLTFAFAPLVWSQAIVTEVYTLNLLLVALLLWALLAERSPWLVGALFGLSVTTHLTTVLLLPLVVLTAPWRDWVRLAGGACLGLLPLLALPFLAAGDSPVVWGDATTLEGWFWLVSGSLYRPNLTSLPPEQLVNRIVSAVPALLRQFAFVGWLFLPFAFTRKRRTQLAWLVLGAVALFAGYALVYNSRDYVLYMLPGLLLSAVLLTPGMRWARAWSLGLPVLLLALNFTSVQTPTRDDVRRVALRLFENTPPRAVLLTEEDENVFSLWYFQHVEGMRPDVTVVDINLLAFDWYRSRLGREDDALFGLFHYDLDGFVQLNAAHRPVCTGDLRQPALIACTEERH